MLEAVPGPLLARYEYWFLDEKLLYCNGVSFFFLSLEVFNEDMNLRLYSNWAIPTATINYLASRWR